MDKPVAARRTRVSRRIGAFEAAALLESLPGAAFRCLARPPWPLTFVSRGAEGMTGHSVEALAGAGWAGIVHAGDLGRLEAARARATVSGSLYALTYRIRTGGGGERWVLERGQAAQERGNAGLCIEGFISDVTDQKQAEERTRWIAEHDPLTLLPNRRLFQERLEDALTRAPKAGFAVLLIDVDEFKRVNDGYGHDAGDDLLCGFAQKLKRACGSGDFVARLGGDEFACICRAETRAELAAHCEAVAAALNARGGSAEAWGECRASIGASFFPEDGRSRADLLKNADIALHAAKAAGKGNMKMFTAAMRSAMQRELAMLSMGRRALRSGLIEPFYQPKVDLMTGELTGFEALLRWRPPGCGVEGPEGIAACLADPVLAPEITDRILDAAIADMQRWRTQGVRFGHVAINAAPADFLRSNFASDLLERLASAPLPPSCLQLEVTESVFVSRSSAEVAAALRKMSAAGIRIALDDFGTGYASLSHLRQFPVDVIKIDRSFIADLATSTETNAIVRALVTLANHLGLGCVAEGIEGAEQKRQLIDMGCREGQGFLFSPAAPSGAVPGLVERLKRRGLAAA